MQTKLAKTANTKRYHRQTVHTIQSTPYRTARLAGVWEARAVGVGGGGRGWGVRGVRGGDVAES